jgi:hypothetical protein
MTLRETDGSMLFGLLVDAKILISVPGFIHTINALRQLSSTL